MDLLVGNDTLTGSLTRQTGEAPGDYAIDQGTLSAGDNYIIDFTTAAFTIVLGQNNPSVLNPIGNQVVTVATPFNYNIPGDTFADLDGDPLTITANFSPAEGFTFTDGVISGIPTTQGTVKVTLRADDGRGGMATLGFDIIIAAVSGPVPTGYAVLTLPFEVHSALDINGHNLEIGSTWEIFNYRY